MKKEIVKFLSCFIPIKKYRKKFRNCFTSKKDQAHFDNFIDYVMIIGRFLEIKTKMLGLKEYSKNIDTIFLGGSSMAYGINPKYFSENSFNLCSNSQDLFTSFNLYKKIKDELPNLKNIFLNYKIFTRGFDISKSKASRDICSSYKFLYNIDYLNNNYIDNYKDIYKTLNSSLQVYSSHNGYIELKNPNCNDPKERARTHIREFNREISQLKWIEKMHHLSMDGGDTVLNIVILPVRKDYKKLCPPHNVIFKEIYDLCKKLNIKIYDFYDDGDFTNEDFYDVDHLNPNGAEKLTKKLKNYF